VETAVQQPKQKAKIYRFRRRLVEKTKLRHATSPPCKLNQGALKRLFSYFDFPLLALKAPCPSLAVDTPSIHPVTADQ
jgi:hypothetical protein